MFRILLPRPPSVNSCYATDFRTKRRFASKGYKDWQDLCAETTTGLAVSSPIEGDVRIIYRYGKSLDKRRRDLMNYEKPLTDFLVKMGVMGDDCQIHHATISWVTDVEPGWVEATIYERDVHVQG